MRTISHRELRNESARVLREVADGATFAVTNHGTVVARLSPPEHGSDLRATRPATARPVYATMTRVRQATTSEEMLDDLRGGR